MKRVGSRRKKTRNIMLKPRSSIGKFPIQGFIQTFNVGDKVVLKVEPSIANGQYFRRFHGKTCEITGKKGASYEVRVRDGGKYKSLIVNPVHMVRN